jgi:hypothetical protein
MTQKVTCIKGVSPIFSRLWRGIRKLPCIEADMIRIRELSWIPERRLVEVAGFTECGREYI